MRAPAGPAPARRAPGRDAGNRGPDPTARPGWPAGRGPGGAAGRAAARARSRGGLATLLVRVHGGRGAARGRVRAGRAAGGGARRGPAAEPGRAARAGPGVRAGRAGRHPAGLRRPAVRLHAVPAGRTGRQCPAGRAHLRADGGQLRPGRLLLAAAARRGPPDHRPGRPDRQCAGLPGRCGGRARRHPGRVPAVHAGHCGPRAGPVGRPAAYPGPGAASRSRAGPRMAGPAGRSGLG